MSFHLTCKFFIHVLLSLCYGSDVGKVVLQLRVVIHTFDSSISFIHPPTLNQTPSDALSFVKSGVPNPEATSHPLPAGKPEL